MARAELLILLGLLMMVAALVLPPVWAWQGRRQLKVVRADFQRIVRAMDRFFNEYHTWPSEYMGQFHDVRYGEQIPNLRLMNALRAVDGEGNPGHNLNRNQVVFLETASDPDDILPLDSQGNYRDPWGTPYQIVVDTDSDESCYVADSIYAMQPDQDLLIWSCGPDQRSGTSDDILGWQRRKGDRRRSW